jgi:hypothetical protein
MPELYGPCKSENGKIAVLEKQVDLMARQITDLFGACPIDQHELWEHPDGDCMDICDDHAPVECWKKYFEMKARKL